MANTISFKLQNLGHGASSEKGGSQVGLVIAEASPSGLYVQPKHVIKDGYCVKIGPVTGDNGTAKLQDYSPEEVSNVEKFSFAVTPPPGPASAPPEPPSAPLVAMAAGRTAITPISALCPASSPSVPSVTMVPLRPASAPPCAPLLRSLVPTSSKSIFAPSIGSSIPIRADHTERRFSLQHIGQPGTESKSSNGTPDSLHRGSLHKSDVSHTSERSRYRDHGVITPYSRKNSTPYQNMAASFNTRADLFKLKSIPVDKHFVFASNTETTCVDTVTASNVLVANILNIYYLQKVKNEFDVAISQTDISFTVSGKTPSCVKQAANKLRSLEVQVKMGVVKLPCPLPSHFLPLFDEDLAVKLNKLQKDCSVQIEVVTRCGDLKNTDHFCRAMKETFSSKEVTLANTLSEYLTTPRAYMWYEVVQGAHTEHEMPEDLIEALNLSYAPKSVVQVAYSGSELTVDFLNKTITLKKSCTNIKSVPSSWHRVDENFGLIELDKALSEAVEAFLLYGMPIVTEDKSYNVDLERMILTDKQSKDDTPIQRVPPAKCSNGLYAPNMVIFLVSGLKEGASKASTRLQALVSELATKLELPLTGTEAIKNALFNKARQYCVKVSRHKERLVLESSPVYAEKVMFQVQSLYTELLTRSAAFPKHWEEMKGKVEVKSVPANRDEYKDVISLLQKTLRPSQVVKVERIQNQWLWDRYVFAKQRMAEKNGGEVNEKELFHGTRKTLPEDVYASEHGFDFRFADKGMWGKGTYFAVNASYSDNYAHQDPKSKQKQLLLASVLTGDAFTSKPDGTLTKPPLKQLATDSMFKDERYDSVTGTTGGSQIYVVYDHDKAYPSYLITYK